MSEIWSPAKKFGTWRRLWLALAQAEKEMGLDITDEQLKEMKNHLDDINFEYAEQLEKKFRHDVMSHVHAFGEQCPKAKPIIHLGATSCFVADNTDVIQIKEALILIKQRLLQLIDCMEAFAKKHRAMPTLGFTHYQPAQLVTVGKRCCLWLQDFVMDAKDLIRIIDELPMRGAKGTTGTQASYLSLFNGDRSKVRKLDQRVCELLGFKTVRFLRKKSVVLPTLESNHTHTTGTSRDRTNLHEKDRFQGSQRAFGYRTVCSQACGRRSTLDESQGS